MQELDFKTKGNLLIKLEGRYILTKDRLKYPSPLNFFFSFLIESLLNAESLKYLYKFQNLLEIEFHFT